MKPEKIEKIKVHVHPIPILTPNEAKAILLIDPKEGLDIEDTNVAMEFRRMQNRIPAYERFFKVVPSQKKATDFKDAPFFKVTVTEDGINLATNSAKAAQGEGVTP